MELDRSKQQRSIAMNDRHLNRPCKSSLVIVCFLSCLPHNGPDLCTDIFYRPHLSLAVADYGYPAKASGTVIRRFPAAKQVFRIFLMNILFAYVAVIAFFSRDCDTSGVT